MSNKHISDVRMHVKLLKLKNQDNSVVAILTAGKDDKTKVYNYNDLSDVGPEFDENTSTYNLIEKAFDVEDFQGNVEVIAAPTDDVNVPITANTTANNQGAGVSTNPMNKFAYALSQCIYDGFLYVVADNLAESDLEAVSDYLYSNQRAMLVTQFKSYDDAKKLFDYSNAKQIMDDKNFNTVYSIVETSDRQPAIQLAAYATVKAPIDLMHVGNLSEFVPDDDLLQEDIDKLVAIHTSCVVNKAGDNMMLQGKSLGDNYADQFINTRVSIDRFEHNLQKQLNAFGQGARMDDDHIGLLVKNVEGTGSDLFKAGFLDSKPQVSHKNRSELSNNEVAKRNYKWITINAQIATSIESIDANVNMII